MIKSDTAVLLATYNGELYLREQLNSLLAQTYQNFICYIHDDNSNDDTMLIIQEYCDKYPDKFLLLKYNSGHGPVNNFMSMIKYVALNSDEQYFLFCDQDDVWLPNKIEIEVNRIKHLETENMNKPILVYCDQKLVDSNLKVFEESSMSYLGYSRKCEEFKSLVFENCAAGCTICINKKLLIICSECNQIENIVMHDWWVMLNASCYGVIDFINIPLMLYRQHGNNTLGAEEKYFISKMKKYIKNPRKHICFKMDHIHKCKRQINEIYIKSLDFKNEEVCEFVKICECRKFTRMILFIKKSYLNINQLFTLLFV